MEELVSATVFREKYTQAINAYQEVLVQDILTRANDELKLALKSFDDKSISREPESTISIDGVPGESYRVALEAARRLRDAGYKVTTRGEDYDDGVWRLLISVKGL